MANKVQSMINAALASGTPAERLTSFLNLHAVALPGAAALANRQARVIARLRATNAYQITERVLEYNRKDRDRSKFERSITRMPQLLENRTIHQRPDQWHAQEEARKANGLRKAALKLAEAAGQKWDEHGSSRGDYLSTQGLDFVPPNIARNAPYLDMGGKGLAVIAICRHRVYAKSCKWYPRDVITHFLIGRNEAGTYFAHAVPAALSTVEAAIDWIWSGKSDKLIARQGDIAVIESRGPARIPTLPSGHRVNGTMIYHETHPPIAKPEYGQAVIVARRAAVRASNETRD